MGIDNTGQTCDDIQVSISNAKKAMAFLKKEKQEIFVPTGIRHGKYELCRSSHAFGFKKGNILVAACRLRIAGEGNLLDPRSQVAQFEYVAVDFLHRRKGLAKKLIHQAMEALYEQSTLRISVASMPDGEPPFLRKILEKAGCKQTSGRNTEGLPMLFYRHPLFVGDASFTEKNYQLQPPC